MSNDKKSPTDIAQMQQMQIDQATCRIDQVFVQMLSSRFYFFPEKKTQHCYNILWVLLKDGPAVGAVSNTKFQKNPKSVREVI